MFPNVRSIAGDSDLLGFNAGTYFRKLQIHSEDLRLLLVLRIPRSRPCRCWKMLEFSGLSEAENTGL